MLCRFHVRRTSFHLFAALAIASTVHIGVSGQEQTGGIQVEHAVGGFSEWVTSAAASPNGRTFAAGTYDEIQLFDSKTGKAVKKLSGKLGRVRSLAFTPDGSRLVAGGFRKVVIFETKNWSVERELTGHRAYVTSVAISPDGSTIASASEDTTVRLSDVKTGESKKLLSNDEDPFTGVAFSPDGKLIAAASGDDTRPTRPGHVRVFKVADGTRVSEFTRHKRAATAVAFSPNGKLIASTGFDSVVQVSDVESGKLLQTYEEHGRPVNAVRFTPDGKHIVSAAGGRAVGRNETHVWETQTGKTVGVLEKHRGPVLDVVVSADGKRILTAGRDKSFMVWNADALQSGASNPIASAVAAAQQLLAANSKTPAANAQDDQQAADDAEADSDVLRVGMIGLDTSHCLAFAGILNDPNHKQHVPGCRVVAVYPQGSPDIESSTKRVPDYTVKIKKLGVEVIDDLDELVKQVDCILLETNDGRPHLEQIIPALKAGLPVFIDKPIAGSLTDAVAIFELGRHYKTPLFSSSSLRYASSAQAVRNGSIGDVTGCSTWSPCSLEKTHPDLFWYGIHGVESLFTVMGAGCKSVTRAHSENFELVAGTWTDGRIGTFRGIRTGSGGYGGTAFGTKGTASVGGYDGYAPLVVQFVKFFKTKEVPIAERETLEIYAFMEAADESKRQGGKPVTIESVLAKARAEAAVKVKEILARD